MVVRTRAAHRDFAVLDCAPSASPAERHQAYRDLGQGWHPDRFAHNPRLQRKADAKMRAINAAYARLGRGEEPKPVVAVLCALGGARRRVEQISSIDKHRDES